MKKLSFVLSALLVTFTGCGTDTGNKNIYNTGDSYNNNGHLVRTTDSETTDGIFEKIKAGTVRVNTTKESGSGWGTGFFVHDDGYIVTNNHVVVGAGELLIGINGEDRLINAKLQGYSECADLAVLKLTENTKIPSVNTNVVSLNWYGVRATMGQKIGVVGYPGDSYSDTNPLFTYNEGVVSTDATYQKSTHWSSTEVFTHSAYTSGGNSGGPVIDRNTGDVLGIHYAGSKDQNRFYAISGQEASKLVDEMIAGYNVYSLGINPRVYLHSDGKPLGVLVKDTLPSKIADVIGIKPNDIIVKLASSLLYEDGDMKRVRTLNKYCSTLRSHNPNASREDIGTVVNIKIQRYAKNNRWVSCVGQLNGRSLTLEDDSSLGCPDSGKISFNEDGFITSGQSTIINPDTTYVDNDTRPDPIEPDEDIIVNPNDDMSKKKYILIYRHYPSNLCESNSWKNTLIERGFVNPLFKEENTRDVYCYTYGKQDDDIECSMNYYEEDHTDTTCVIGFDQFKSTKSNRNISDDSNKFDFLKTIINDVSLSE